MKYLIPILLFTSTALAETATYSIKGMHCNSCVKTIKNKVCGAMKDLTACTPKLVDAEKEMGELTVSAEKIDQNQIKKLVEEAGYTLSTSK